MAEVRESQGRWMKCRSESSSRITSFLQALKLILCGTATVELFLEVSTLYPHRCPRMSTMVHAVFRRVP